MENLTEKQKVEITMEMINTLPFETICVIAQNKHGQLIVETGAGSSEYSVDMMINDKRYRVKSVITCEEI